MIKWHPYLWLECLALTVALPTILYIFPMRGAVFGILWLLTLVIIVAMYRKGAWKRKEIFRTDLVCWKELKPILFRFVLSALVLGTGVALFEPERLLSLPQEKPQLWMMIMVIYPLLSVFPQEVIFRTFFFWRYSEIFSNPRSLIYASGIAFGYVHVIFDNWVALLLSCIGGVLFAQTYDRTRSLALVWIEHALYGCFIFTIGLGWYFYSGAVR